MSVADRLKAKFDTLEASGLVDVKFDVDMSAGVQDKDVVLREVEALYTAVELGLETPLEFNDSQRGLMTAL